MTEVDRVQYGLAVGSSWAAQLDHKALAALRRLVPANTAVAAVGDWGRADGCRESLPVAYIVGHRSHLSVVIEELRHCVPGISFVFDVPDPMMSVQLHDARLIWGHQHLPVAPIGDNFAHQWAMLKVVQRDHFQKVKATQVQAALHDFQTLRTICCISQLPIPQLLDLPSDVADLYVARNMGMEVLPACFDVFTAALHQLAADSLHQLAAGAELSEVAADAHSWLFD